MISALRRIFVDSWFGRVMALLIFAAFVVWGMGGVFTNMGGPKPDDVVKLGDRSISAADLSRAIQNELPQLAKQMGISDPSQLPRAEKAQAARQVLQRLIAQQELLLQADRNGMKVPDSVVREETFSMPYFKGTNGKFDRAVFNRRIADARMTEHRFLDMIRDDITVRGLGSGLGDTVKVPPSFVQRILDFNTRQYVLDVLPVDASSLAAPPQPTDAQLERFYHNHPWLFSTPEYRHAKVVVLTTQTVMHSFDVPEGDLKRLYDFHSQKYHVPETRHLEVLTFQKQADAAKAIEAWKAGASWQAMQSDFKDAAAVDMPETRQSDIPSPELSEAAFSAPQGDIQGPLKTETGWVAFRVIDIKAPHETRFEDAKEDLREEVAKAQAPEVLPARVRRLEDAVAGSSDLDHVPSDIGAVPAAGTLDAKGLTQSGEPAPIPGDAALRQKIIAQIFEQDTKAHPTVIHGPDGSAFAVQVDKIEPNHLQAFDSVKAEVATEWADDARRHEADQKTTALFVEAQKGGGIAKALADKPEASALQKGVVFSRMQRPTLPQAVIVRALGARVGESFMVNDGDKYFVGTLTEEKSADAKTIDTFKDRLEAQLTSSMQEDVSMSYIRALENRVKPQPNMGLLQKVIDSTGGKQ